VSKEGKVDEQAALELEESSRALDFFSRYSLLLVLGLLMVLFSVLAPNEFFVAQNFKSILASQLVIVVIAVGATIPIIAGEFDASVGYCVGLVQALAIGMMSKYNVPPVLAILAVLAVGAGVGLVNGLLIVHLNLNSFITTLATGSVCAGITVWYTGGLVIFGNVPTSYTNLGRSEFLGLPLPVFYCSLLVLLIACFFSFLPAGRRMYAIGGNRNAALLNGINVNRNLIGAFTVAGLLAGVAGVVLSAQIGSGEPDLGHQYLLPAFAAAFLGATAFRPGRFNVMGTVVGVYVLAVPITGLQILGVETWFQQVFNGLALIVAIAVSGQIGLLRSRRARRARIKLTVGRAASEAAADGPGQEGR
jgi:ribose transport system permease protein